MVTPPVAGRKTTPDKRRHFSLDTPYVLLDTRPSMTGYVSLIYDTNVCGRSMGDLSSFHPGSGIALKYDVTVTLLLAIAVEIPAPDVEHLMYVQRLGGRDQRGISRVHRLVGVLLHQLERAAVSAWLETTR